MFQTILLLNNHLLLKVYFVSELYVQLCELILSNLN